MEILKYFGKLLLVSIMFVIYVILYALYSLWGFLIPGECDNCRMKWRWFRRSSLNNRDKPVSYCRKCNKFKEIINPKVK